MYGAHGSASSMEHVKNKSSACVEVLRSLSHRVSGYFKLADYHRGHREVDIYGDIQSLCLDMETQKIHTIQRRSVPPPVIRTNAPKGKKANKKTAPKSGVKDILVLGKEALMEKGLFERWKKRTGEVDEEDALQGEDEFASGTVFDAPEGTFDIDHAADPEVGQELMC